MFHLPCVAMNKSQAVLSTNIPSYIAGNCTLKLLNCNNCVECPPVMWEKLVGAYDWCISLSCSQCNTLWYACRQCVNNPTTPTCTPVLFSLTVWFKVITPFCKHYGNGRSSIVDRLQVNKYVFHGQIPEESLQGHLDSDHHRS